MGELLYVGSKLALVLPSSGIFRGYRVVLRYQCFFSPLYLLSIVFSNTGYGNLYLFWYCVLFYDKTQIELNKKKKKYIMQEAG